MWMWPSSRTRPQNICHFQKSFGKLCTPCLSHTIMLPTTKFWRDLEPTIFQRALLGASLDYLWRSAKMTWKNCVSDMSHIHFTWEYSSFKIIALSNIVCCFLFYTVTVQRDYKHCVKTSHSVLFIIRWTTEKCSVETLNDVQRVCKSLGKIKAKSNHKCFTEAFLNFWQKMALNDPCICDTFKLVSVNTQCTVQ